MVKEWLLSGMLSTKENAEEIADTIITELADHALTKSHARHISFDKCKEIGLEVVEMESDHALQSAILSVHHACIHTLSATVAYKLIENHNGVAFIQIIK